MNLFSNDPKKTKTYSGKFKKQSSWFKTDADIEFEDSFKFWFALMWQNMYIFLGALGLVVTMLELTHPIWVINTVIDNINEDGFWGGLFTAIGLSVIPLMFALVSYKGFWQYWDDMKHGRSR